MASGETFGAALKRAREQKMLSIPDVAACLKLRKDVIASIEAEDFRRIPPKGYAKNMIGAYAQLVGLDPNAIKAQYVEELMLVQQGLRETQPTDIDELTYRASASRQAAYNQSRENRVNTHRAMFDSEESRGRQHHTIYDDEPQDYSVDEGQSSAALPEKAPRDSQEAKPKRQGAQRNAGSQKRAEGGKRKDVKASKRGTASGSSRKPRRKSGEISGTTTYGNMAVGVSAKKSKIPLIIAIIVLIGLIFAIYKIAFANNGSNTETGSDASISGLNDPESNGIATTTQQKVKNPTPTAAVFSYKVSSSGPAYIVIYQNEQPAPVFEGEVEAGGHDTYDVTDTLTFVTTNPNNVTITVGGEKVTPKESKAGSGVFKYDVSFQQYLADWKAKNEPKEEDSSSDQTASTTESTQSTSAKTAQ